MDTNIDIVPFSNIVQPYYKGPQNPIELHNAHHMFTKLEIALQAKQLGSLGKCCLRSSAVIYREILGYTWVPKIQ